MIKKDPCAWCGSSDHVEGTCPTIKWDVENAVEITPEMLREWQKLPPGSARRWLRKKMVDG